MSEWGWCALRMERFLSHGCSTNKVPYRLRRALQDLVQALMQRCLLHLPQLKFLASRRFYFPAVYTQSSTLSRFQQVRSHCCEAQLFAKNKKRKKRTTKK
jgi:hypothetical protein